MLDDKSGDCFNFMRLVAAFLVLYGHMYIVAGNTEPVAGTFSLSGIGIAIFFSISGYLVTQSWRADPHAGRFALRRALRLFPALTVVVLLSAFALGPSVTTLKQSHYFDSVDTWAYLRNIVLITDYKLPGVFETLPMHGVVNSSLWTLPIGALMFFILAILGSTRAMTAPKIMLGFVIMLCGCAVLFGRYYPDPLYLGALELHQILTLAPYFWVSALLCLFKDAVDFTLTRSVLVYSITAMLASTQYFTLWSWVAIPYLTISFASQPDRLFRIPAQMGDLSYGIYLYTFPVQQMLWQLYHARLPLGQILALSAVVSSLLAWATWEAVEYPALRLKRRIKAHELKMNRRARA